ncbi:SAM-dependent methyltransferase [Actinocorallia sp. API 0066]|uniref:SAM-dependent methyltransferase n=1 Tax=Actinocorallia sp. API 0066 TaxID=2896846 RepID=UPI001E4AFE75|nr:SAM-dependent methyltransferase [Actinocorallia sp. API 0066]MCD0450485.1 SAM-dependent methyltransferase [Actinocorallia sp. API 0066]
MDEPVPEGIDIDVTVPNVARMYDYYLGGKDNYAVDRETAARVLRAAPQTPALARANRAFLGRAVRHLVHEAGITQFLDLGAGLPTQGNVHEVAQEADPASRCVYVDNDPVVLAHGRALLTGVAGAAVLAGDLRRPADLLADLRHKATLDLTEPVAVLLVAVLHCLTDEEDPWKAVRAIGDAVPSGSHLVVSHITAAELPDAAEAGAAVYRRAGAAMTLRPRAAIARFFDGFDLLEPGLVPLTEWRPGPAGAPLGLPAWFLCGVAVKP